MHDLASMMSCGADSKFGRCISYLVANEKAGGEILVAGIDRCILDLAAGIS